MSGSAIKAVVCDADGTLFQLKAPLATTYSEILTGFGYRLDEEVFSSNIRRVWRDFEPEYLNDAEQYKTSPERERAVWYSFIEKICRACGVMELSVDAKEAIYSHYAKGESRSVCHELHQLLVEAAHDGLAIFLATNNDMRVHRIVEALLPSGFFIGIFTAGELGWKKPSPHYFKAIENRIQLSPQEIVHIGNDAELDINAAEKAGWSALRFSPHNPMEIRVLFEALQNSKN